MRTIQLRNLSTVGVLWLALGAGCQKDPPKLSPEVAHSCDDGICCMQDTRQYDYLETIENQPADLTGRTLIFKNGFPSNAMYEEFKAHTIGVCTLSLSKISGLKNTYPLDTESWSDQPLHYRVWGKVYHDRFTQTIIASPILKIYVDRIEEVN